MASKQTNQEKEKQLGMPLGTAANRLKKSIMFQLIVEAGHNTCFQCGQKITSIDDFTIEHKKTWLHSHDPLGAYMDLKNIGFSHASCNSGARRVRKDVQPCGTNAAYDRGCRCDACRKARSEYRKARGG